MIPYRNAIASIESAGSGDYSAVGPEVRGDRAYGRYQVMGANIPSWTRNALGVELAPEQFLASPEAQDAVFDHVFGGYVQKYGPAGAASMWFSGDPTPDGDSDGYTKDTAYVERFMGALGQEPQNALSGFDPMYPGNMRGPDFNPNAGQNALRQPPPSPYIDPGMFDVTGMWGDLFRRTA
jgi:hypothetical protein